MTLTQQDFKLIKQTLKQEFAQVEKQIKASLKPEFEKSEQRIKASLKPEFEKSEQRIKASLKPEFEKINRKIDKLRRDNRQDHNLIIKTFDERDITLKNRVKRLEDITSIISLSKPLV